MIRRAPSRATSSSTSLSSRPEPNRASISPRIFSVGDTRDGTGVVLPVQTLAVLYGTYARRHLHRRMDTAQSLPLKGFRRWASTRTVSSPSRQPATGLPGDYPDRTHTGWRRRASDSSQVIRTPPKSLGALPIFVEVEVAVPHLSLAEW